MAQGFVWNGKEYRELVLGFETIEQVDEYLASCKRSGVEVESAGTSGLLGEIALYLKGWFPVTPPAACFATFA